MSIKPLLSALWRNRLGPSLVAFETAICLAVIVNAMYFVVERAAKLNEPAGMDVANIFLMNSEGYAPDLNYTAAVRADLELLNSTPGVAAATTINRIPLSMSGSARTYSATPGQTGKQESASLYLVTERGLDALGVSLSEGHAFNAEVIAPPKLDYFEAIATTGPEIIVTRALASKLFPDGKAVGKVIYDSNDRALRVVGVVKDMLGIDPMMVHSNYVVLLPSVSPGPSVWYLVRAQPGRRDELMGKLPAMLDASQSGRAMTRTESMEDVIARTYAVDGAPNAILSVISILVAAVAGLGIFSLAMFSVTARTRQIGIRRALGASKLDIVKSFLLENWLITTAGVVAGCVLALAIGVQLSLMLEAPRLPLYYLVAGTLAMWVLGLCATLIPAGRAAAVSPAVATRSL